MILGSNQLDDILAAHDGVVTFSGTDKYGGKFIDITQGNIKTRYLHNRQNLVSINQQVRAGELIGYIGSTGFSSGRHLHLKFGLITKELILKIILILIYLKIAGQ